MLFLLFCGSLWESEEMGKEEIEIRVGEHRGQERGHFVYNGLFYTYFLMSSSQ